MISTAVNSILPGSSQQQAIQTPSLSLNDQPSKTPHPASAHMLAGPLAQIQINP